jgi:broad specificity phosphatase PhoE
MHATATRLIFFCAGATSLSRIGAFPAPDDGLDEGGARKAAAARPRGPKPDIVAVSPARAAIETAEALGFEAAAEPALADLDFGQWSGRTLLDVEASDAPALRAWFADPSLAAPGGESMAELVVPVGAWVDLQAGTDRVILAITHAAVMRAALAHVLSVPVASVMRIDVAPLSTLHLSFHGQWRLQELRRAGD